MIKALGAYIVRALLPPRAAPCRDSMPAADESFNPNRQHASSMVSMKTTAV